MLSVHLRRGDRRRALFDFNPRRKPDFMLLIPAPGKPSCVPEHNVYSALLTRDSAGRVGVHRHRRVQIGWQTVLSLF